MNIGGLLGYKWPVPLVYITVEAPDGNYVNSREVVESPRFGHPAHIEILRVLRIAAEVAEAAEAGYVRADPWALPVDEEELKQMLADSGWRYRRKRGAA